MATDRTDEERARAGLEAWLDGLFHAGHPPPSMRETQRVYEVMLAQLREPVTRNDEIKLEVRVGKG